jgi:hypothetical protein
MKIILKSVLFGAALLASSSAFAGRASQSFAMRLVVEDACRVDAARFEQGRRPLSAAATSPAADGIEVSCRGSSPYAVNVAVGPVPMPSVAPAEGDATTLVVSY